MRLPWKIYGMTLYEGKLEEALIETILGITKPVFKILNTHYLIHKGL